MSGVAIDARGLPDAISDMLAEYGDSIYIASEKGLDAAEKVMIKNLKEASPISYIHATKVSEIGAGKARFRNSWKGSGHKYKLSRFVGNTKMVRSKGKNIPLSNIFEYSTTNHAKPFVKQTFESSVNEMAHAMIETVKKEV